MERILGVVVPVFAVILLGSVTARRRLIDTAGLRGLNDFVYFIGLPALLFGSVSGGGRAPVFGVAGVYFASCLIVYALAMLLARLVLRADPAGAAMFGLNATFGNTVFMGIPIVSAAFGKAGLVPLLAIIALHSALLLSLAAVLVEVGGHRGGALGRVLRVTLPGVLRNPVILAILAAFLWRLSGGVLPEVAARLIAMLGATAPALALFCLGASLPGFGRVLVAPQSLLISLLKLAVLPLVVAALGRLAGLAGLPFAVAVLTAGMPTGANAFLLARRTATLAEDSAAAVALSTALSVLGLGFLMALVR
ncbi:MAG: AEC family transporter [Rhodospirillales bacterium]|nr:AEC family transporter [Rhodospirillales bacterium]